MKTCRTCGAALIVKQTQRKSSQLLKQYYYTAYYFCPHCNKIYHDDKFKVMNENYDLFTEQHLIEGPIDVEVWTDGACSFNGRENAKAAWAFVSGSYEQSGIVEGKQTNNTAEASAIYYALLWAAKKGYKIIKVYSDSQITINNLKKDRTSIKENKHIFDQIFDVINENGLTVYYEKVLGHSGNENNERADRLANRLVGIK
jgi:ribonuclease HI